MAEYSTNESVLCFHGPLIYAAKILKVQEGDAERPDAITGKPGAQYFVHYKGWKTTWDEWVPTDRLLKDNEVNRIKQKELKQQQTAKERPPTKASTSGNATGSTAGASTNTNTGTRSGTRKDLGTRGTKRGRDEVEGTKKPDMRLNVPEQLKAKLVDDWEAVTKNALLVTLPCKPTVEQLLTEFETHLRNTNPSHLKDSASLSAAVIAGLKTYFDKALGNCLLYREERPQFGDIRIQYITGQHVKQAAEMSQIYGAEHLLRMLVTMPSMIAQSTLDSESTDIVRDYVNELFVWMLQEEARLFQPEYREYASPAYQNVAKS
ncbi:MRG-domain-containing protein [Mycena indigotica]|uniref:Chromatin modification-related protein EAF3 n=1 Tax=Mycena indigotica TaxID=2126181 RepID=A0A8H6S1J9_9AGAR|nr:MRG-domain-containing protein [Mycena indigotica]KAF7290520.1 MRG-domain-containing protein [Mycena indigotica]